MNIVTQSLQETLHCLNSRIDMLSGQKVYLKENLDKITIDLNNIMGQKQELLDYAKNNNIELKEEGK